MAYKFHASPFIIVLLHSLSLSLSSNERMAEKIQNKSALP